VRILTVVGARPQFIKCAVVSRALRARHEEILVHTGQHHDYGMSELFFEQLAIPEPDLNLGIAGGTHGEMTGRMIESLERVMVKQMPDAVLVYGDTNSTMAGALAAAKLHIPVAHVEAGLRSFNRRMPEEINRVVTDHVSSLLFCPTENARALLAKEGISAGVHFTGDVMFDSVLANLDRARTAIPKAELFAALGFSPAEGCYAFATLHRSENTDDRTRLGAILDALSKIGLPVLLPLHPRTKRVLTEDADLALRVGGSLKIVEPIGYLELLLVAGEAELVLTDSGGLQKEALFLGVPCVTLRDETEWIETVAAGANIVAGAEMRAILEAAAKMLARGRRSALSASAQNPFGDGKAAEKIVRILEAG
jgi:UDP-N-acetylglucosamine 2-epimerase